MTDMDRPGVEVFRRAAQYVRYGMHGADNVIDRTRAATTLMSAEEVEK